MKSPHEAVNAGEPGSTRATYTLPPRAKAHAEAARERLDQIRDAPLPDETELPLFTQRQRQRLQALASRDQLRKGP